MYEHSNYEETSCRGAMTKLFKLSRKETLLYGIAAAMV